MTSHANQPDDSRPRILIVDDDPIVAESIAEMLRADGASVATCATGEEALEAIEEADRKAGAGRDRPFGLVITDVAMPGMGGLELLKQIRKRFPAMVVLVVTGYATIENAVEAVKQGAADYLTKPLVDDELRIAVEKASRQQALVAENMTLRRQLDGRYGLDAIVGADHRMLRVYDLVEAVAPTKTTVLMTGESGAGKSLIARAIHQRSDRAAKPFVELACGSIPETILESELFGHVKGAFTGAHADKPGKFLAAHGGTIFLDEINSASPAMQLKLLRVLQEKRFEPVGGNDTVEVDVRVILATNQSLERLVQEGRFRQDLYYRVNVVKIELPPLRDRPSDIPLLVQHFLEQCSASLGRQVTGVTDEAMQALRRYAWPGNVRELGNAIERAAVLGRNATLTLDDLPHHIIENRPETMPFGQATGASADDADAPWTPTPLAEALQEPEKRIILKALRANEWNRSKTADDLGINRTTLYKKMKAYGLDRMAG
jgi:DNA-binding NtrC family response regulator